MKVSPDRKVSLRTIIRLVGTLLFCGYAVVWLPQLAHAEEPQLIPVNVDWGSVISTSKTTPSVMLIPEPPIRKGGPYHEKAIAAIEGLGARFVKYNTYCAFPRRGVAELEPPTAGKTFWDFSQIDPDMIDILRATRGREPVINFNAIPAWMFKNEKAVGYPDNPDGIDWDYCALGNGQRRELVDPSGRQLADYYARIVSWYTQGGFTDENGRYHRSGYHYEIPWWGVLNEPDVEHVTSAEEYTRRYDLIVSAIRQVSPATRFVSLALAQSDPDFVEYFLDGRHHQASIPIDMISYHFYARPSKAQTLDHWQYTLFDQADGFLNRVMHIESIRKRLAPRTRVQLDEIGTILAGEEAAAMGKPPQSPDIPSAYWNLSAAVYAYFYIELTKRGIDVVNASQLIGYPPSMFPSISMLDWNTGESRPRLQLLQLLVRHFGPGDRLLRTESGDFPSDIAAQAFLTTRGGKELLLVNKRLNGVEIDLSNIGVVDRVESIDAHPTEHDARQDRVSTGRLQLPPFGVAVVTFR
jgi:hypothetical protein